MRHELVTDGADLGVHDKALEIQMRQLEDRHGGGVVAAAGFEANEAVLDNVDAADAVGVAELVERNKELDGVGVRLLWGDDLCRDALFELDGDIGGGRGRIFGGVGHGPHVGGRALVRVLEDAGLVGAVGKVGVHAPGLRFCASNGDIVLLGVVEEVLTALEFVAELREPPWGDDFDGGLEGVEGKLEADLVVALAGAAVRDKVALVLLGDADLGAGDDGAGKRGAEEVAAFVAGVALDGAEAELFNEFLLEVKDNLLVFGVRLGSDSDTHRCRKGA